MSCIKHSPKATTTNSNGGTPTGQNTSPINNVAGAGKRRNEEEINDGEIKKAKNQETHLKKDSMSIPLDRMEKMENKITANITRKLESVEANLQGRLEVLEARVDKLEEENSSLNHQIMTCKKENEYLQKKVHTVEGRLDKLFRRNNLMFFGIIEAEGETREQLHENIQRILRNDLEIDDVFIEYAYRIKKSTGFKYSRAVKVTFAGLSERETVLQNRKLLKNKRISIYINPNLSKEDSVKAKFQRELRKKKPGESIEDIQ
ncbi:unnamed protein product [Allacma fusca]|uniref:Uncharacterized protein n=1 Tax=Allacma fusca TaxID=39272 RepID=A0A8J2KA03_9HEXA|nr:unnamed protein product [Allacma fusca]